MMNGAPIVLSLCDYTGVMVKPWLDAGYACHTVDIRYEQTQTVAGGKWTQHAVDILDWLPPRDPVAICFAFPPCTNLAVSGARWFQDKGLRGLEDGIRLVRRCAEICQWTTAPWMLENPVSTLSTYWRKPDHKFDPCDFGGYMDPPGDTYTKRTCLWTGNGFRFPDPRPVFPVEGSRMHYMSPSDTRGDDRSVTPEGFARAVYEANRQE
jgi:hypothetical protein